MSHSATEWQNSLIYHVVTNWLNRVIKAIFKSSKSRRSWPIRDDSDNLHNEPQESMTSKLQGRNYLDSIMKPPYEINSKILALVTGISEKIGFYEL